MIVDGDEKAALVNHYKVYLQRVPEDKSHPNLGEDEADSVQVL